MTLRLTDEQAADLEAVASVESVPVAEVVRRAIAAFIEERRRDPAFQRRLRASVDRQREVLDRLAPATGPRR